MWFPLDQIPKGTSSLWPNSREGGSWAEGGFFSGPPTGFDRWARKVPLLHILHLGSFRRCLLAGWSLKILSSVIWLSPEHGKLLCPLRAESLARSRLNSGMSSPRTWKGLSFWLLLVTDKRPHTATHIYIFIIFSVWIAPLISVELFKFKRKVFIIVCTTSDLKVIHIPFSQ